MVPVVAVVWLRGALLLLDGRHEEVDLAGRIVAGEGDIVPLMAPAKRLSACSGDPATLHELERVELLAVHPGERLGSTHGLGCGEVSAEVTIMEEEPGLKTGVGEREVDPVPFRQADRVGEAGMVLGCFHVEQAPDLIHFRVRGCRDSRFDELKTRTTRRGRLVSVVRRSDCFRPIAASAREPERAQPGRVDLGDRTEAAVQVGGLKVR